MTANFIMNKTDAFCIFETGYCSSFDTTVCVCIVCFFSFWLLYNVLRLVISNDHNILPNRIDDILGSYLHSALWNIFSYYINTKLFFFLLYDAKKRKNQQKNINWFYSI